ncbi:hypothetical protein AQ902_11155 [Burkholderia pseudomallei]|nr:hypothetical protein AQ902_11155 [Burkholderia pseudomallei]ONC11617.1 hypothetical protein AQ909_24000 [Burkholderia pseudomallei]
MQPGIPHRYWVADVRRRMSNVECRTSNVERRTSNVERRTSNVERRMSNVERRTSNAERRTPNVERRMLNTKRRTPSSAASGSARRRPCSTGERRRFVGRIASPPAQHTRATCVSRRAIRAATDFTHCYARRSSNVERIPYTAGV